MSALVTLIFFDTALLVAGIVALYLRAGALVGGASRLAIGLGPRATIVGATIVAFATTTPEFFVAVPSGLGYSPDFGPGAIIGSNITNVGLALGISTLTGPMGVSTVTLRRHVPFMITAVVVLVAFGMDGNLGVVDGGVLPPILVASTGYLLYRAWSATVDATGVDEINTEDEDEVSARFKDVVYLVLGLPLLFVGSNRLTQGGQGLLEPFGFGPRFIGLTVLAFGTSLPELAASVINVARGESELSIDNVVSSNVYNAVAAPGILAIMVPVSVPPSTILLDFPALLVFTFGIIAPMFRNRDAPRLDGDILVVGYPVFFWLILL